MRAYYATLTEGWYIVWFREHKYDLSFDFSRLCFAPFLSLQIPWVLIDSWHSCKSALAIHVAYFIPISCIFILFTTATSWFKMSCLNNRKIWIYKGRTKLIFLPSVCIKCNLRTSLFLGVDRDLRVAYLTAVTPWSPSCPSSSSVIS